MPRLVTDALIYRILFFRFQLREYRRQEVLAFQDALTLFTEAKIKTARDTYALLAKSLLLFKQMPD